MTNHEVENELQSLIDQFNTMKDVLSEKEILGSDNLVFRDLLYHKMTHLFHKSDVLSLEDKNELAKNIANNISVDIDDGLLDGKQLERLAESFSKVILIASEKLSNSGYEWLDSKIITKDTSVEFKKD